MRRLVVAIDGPAGVGKSTVAKGVARRFGLRYLDTGAMYRALALKAERAGLGADDVDALAQMAGRVEIRFEGEPEEQRVLLDGEDVSEQIRRPEISDLASAISVHSAVRRRLVALQQRLASEGGWTMEGRDTTTVVAPHADLKIYLDASAEVRAQRRVGDLLARGMPADYESVLREIRERDERDRTRADSPLRVAEDAVTVRTDDMNAEQVIEHIVGLVPV
jgi:cytidylate kinase